MYKLGHILFAVLWFTVITVMIPIFESGNYGVLDIIIMFYAIGCAITQIFHILADIYNNMFSE